jgi:hypothetical protein
MRHADIKHSERSKDRSSRWHGSREVDNPAHPRDDANLPAGRRLLQSDSRAERRRDASPPPNAAPPARDRSRDSRPSAIVVDDTPPRSDRNRRSISPQYSPLSPHRAFNPSFMATIPAAPAEPECEVLGRQLLRTIQDLVSLTVPSKTTQPLRWSELATQNEALHADNRIVTTFRDILHTSHEFFSIKEPVAYYFTTDSTHFRCLSALGKALHNYFLDATVPGSMVHNFATVPHIFIQFLAIPFQLNTWGPSRTFYMSLMQSLSKHPSVGTFGRSIVTAIEMHSVMHTRVSPLASLPA